MKKGKVKQTQPKRDQPTPPRLPKEQIGQRINFEIIGLGICILLGIIIYSNSFNCSFQFDDQGSIVENARIRNFPDVKALWDYHQNRFVPYFTFALNYHFGELNVWGYHFVNLVIHLINTCLVYLLSLSIFSSPVLKNNGINKNRKEVALFTALLFVSHPLATQSVTFIVQRMSSMAAMFYLLSLYLFVRGRLVSKGNKNQYIFFVCSFISALLAMHSKENAYTIPFAIILIEIFFFRSTKWHINFKDYRVILVLTGLVTFLIFVLYNKNFSIFNPMPPDLYNDYRTITSQNYLLTQFSVIVKYIQLLILPVNQNFDYDYPLSNSFFELKTLVSFIILSGLIGLAIFLFKKQRIISFGIFWFFLTVSIESSVIPIKDLIFEHRTYLPSFGFFLIVSSGISYLISGKYKYLAIGLLVVIIGTNSILTYNRNKVWKDEMTLWNDVISKSPDKARAYNNRGNRLMENNRPNEAFKDFNKAIELQPNHSLAYYNRGTIYEKENNTDLALDDYNKSIKLNPNYPKVYNNRGNIFKKENKLDDAFQDYTKAIELNRSYVAAYNNRGTIYMLEKKYNEAIEDFDKAIKIQHDCAEAFANKGLAELNLGNKKKSCQDLKMAVDLGFKPAVEYYNNNCQ